MPRKGEVTSPETKARLSAATSGRALSDEHRDAIKRALAARWADPDFAKAQLTKMRAGKARRKLSEG